MKFQISAQILQMLEEGFLADLRKQNASRSKPSKAVLEALKHSTSTNKSYKIEVQNLRQQLSSITHERQFLREMVENLKQQAQFLKTSKQEKVKELLLIQTKLQTQVCMLLNQNNLLKKEIQLVKKKNNQLFAYSPKANDVSIVYENLSSIPLDFRIKSKDELGVSERCALYSALQQTTSVIMHESVKFNDYVNFEQQKQVSHLNRSNSKPKTVILQVNKSTQETHNNIETKQCEQLGRMLFPMQETNHEDDQVNGHPSQNQLSSLDYIPPKITQITSQHQIVIQEDQKGLIQTPTLPRRLFNARESKFLVFAEEKSQLNDQAQNILPKMLFNLKTQLTFMTLQTRKSLQQHVTQKLPNKGDQGKEIDLPGDKSQPTPNKRTPEQEFGLANISGVDCQGLLNDIYENQHKQKQIKNNFSYVNAFNPSIENLSFAQVKSKQTASEVLLPFHSKTTIENINQTTVGNNRSQMIPNQKQIQRLKKKQEVNVAVHFPRKYINISQSYKTIELDKLHGSDCKDQGSYKTVVEQESDKIQKQGQINQNSQSFLFKSRTKENSRMNNSRLMANSKLMMFSHRRINNENKSLSPLSIQNQVCNVRQTSPIQKYVASYSILNSTKSRKIGMMTSIFDDQNINNESCQDVTIISSSPSVIKRYNDKPNKTKDKVVSFKLIDDQILQSLHQIHTLQD